MLGNGLTVILYIAADPAHPLSVGVTFNSETSALLPEFVAVKPGTFAVPEAANPVNVVEFVQA